MVINQGFIHNIYGDAQDLIDSAPEDVVCIPRSWTPEGEAQLAQMMQEQGVAAISCLPCFLFRHNEVVYEIRVADMPKPWDWTAILAAKNALIEQIDNPTEGEE